jgi:hypothetical protein
MSLLLLLMTRGIVHDSMLILPEEEQEMPAIDHRGQIEEETQWHVSLAAADESERIIDKHDIQSNQYR